MSAIQSNPQAAFPVPNNPLQGRAYYEVNPVPYDVTVERAHAGQDVIRQDGLYYSIPPTREEERQNLDEGRQPGEVAMETYYRVAAEQWEKEKERLDEDWDESFHADFNRRIMRANPANYTEVTPGKFEVTPGGTDVYGMFRPKDQEYNLRPPNYWYREIRDKMERGEEVTDKFIAMTMRKAWLLDQQYRDEDGEWNTGVLVKEGVFVTGILLEILGQNYVKASPTVWVFYNIMLAVWRYLTFYRQVDPTASVAAATYWSSSYYLYGSKYMPYSFMLDLLAGRLWLVSENAKNPID